MKNTAPPPASMTLVTISRDELRELIADALAEAAAEPPREVMTELDALALMQCSRPTFRKLLAEGLPCCQLGSTRRYLRGDLLAWLKARSTK